MGWLYGDWTMLATLEVDQQLQYWNLLNIAL